MELTLNVLKALKNENKQTVDVEHIQDIVEKVLIESGHARRLNHIFCTELEELVCAALAVS